MLTKTVKITNRRNVLVQIPGFIIAAWPLADELEVYYDEDKQTVTIRPAVSRRVSLIEKSNSVARTAET